MTQMGWWQVLVLFVAAPAVLFATVTALVLLLSKPRIPDGLARAAEVCAASESQPSQDSDPDPDPGPDADEAPDLDPGGPPPPP
jgi:hypothetical protein